MTYTPSFKVFYFEGYSYDAQSRTTRFEYSFDKTERFVETVRFGDHGEYNPVVLDRVLALAFLIAGISYYKAQPTKHVVYEPGELSQFQSTFFSTIYRDGLSQFVYENGLSPDDIATFDASLNYQVPALSYGGQGTDVLQSGGKDSLLLATLLQKKLHDFEALFMQQSDEYPAIIDELGVKLRRFERTIDRPALAAMKERGGLNGHVPVTFITLSYGLIDSVLHNRNTLLAAIGWEGEEPHDYIGDYPVTHQWSKTWLAEQEFSEYIQTVISPDLCVGSPIRSYSELMIADLFVQNAWKDFGQDFSSCNVANYRQGHGNKQLTWCGHCPKCANSYLLFSAFVPKNELNTLFGRDLYQSEDLAETFKGLLGIDGIIKPFECVGEVDELRWAYGASQAKNYSNLPFTVPDSHFDRSALHPSQAWALRMIQ